MANSSNNAAGKRAAARKRNKIIIFAVEILVIAVLLGALYILKDFGKPSDGGSGSGSGRGDGTGAEGSGEKGPLILDDDDAMNDIKDKINEQLPDSSHMEGYRNIALFGVDSRSGALAKGTLSDCIIIASINQETGDVKLVSVYRDTYLNLSNDKYDKCNHAYSYGGAEQAIKMLNMNLDLNITDFVTVGFEGLTATVDALGGVYLDVDEEELKHINSYQKTMAEDLKISWTPVENTGYQKLNGLQATAYCRIRYRKGNDFARAAAQREVIQAIADTAKKADLKTLTKVANDVSQYVYTSIKMDEILSLLGEIAGYNIVDEGGFPEASMRGADTLGSKGSCVFPINLKENVVWLHEFLFGDTNYEPSKEVQSNSKVIHDFVSQYVNID